MGTLAVTAAQRPTQSLRLPGALLQAKALGSPSVYEPHTTSMSTGAPALIQGGTSGPAGECARRVWATTLASGETRDRAPRSGETGEFGGASVSAVRVRWHLVGAGVALAFGFVASPALAADAVAEPLEGRWEFASESGSPLDYGPTYDFVATGPGAVTNRVVRNWPIGCQAFNGQIRLTRIASPAAQPAYRGTFVSLIPPACRQGPVVNIELVIRPDGIARLFFNDGKGIVQHYRRRSIQIGQLNLTFRDRIDKAVAELRPSVLRLGRQWNAVQRTIAEHSATASGLLDVSAERKGIARAEKTLADYRGGLTRLARLEQRTPGDPGLALIRQQWENRVQDFRVEIGVLGNRIGRKERQRLQEEQALRAAGLERTRLDAALTEIGRRISIYDFEISEVTVTADGAIVFRARSSTLHAKALKRIDAKLRRMETSLAKLDAERKRAKADFLVAQREALAAGERIQEVIWQNFAAGAAADVGFLALDLGVAALRGGFIGVAAEAGKKIAESLVLTLAPLPTPGEDYGDIRRLYGETVKDVIGAQALGRTALDRLLKETHFRILVKDPATGFLTKRVFDPVKFVTDFNHAGRVLAREPSEASLREVERTVKALLGARGRLADFTARQKTRPGRLRGLAESVAKDAAKVLIKKTLDTRELESYIAYLEKEVYASAVTTHFLGVSSMYWEVKAGEFTEDGGLVEPGYEQLMDEKRRLLELPSAERVLVSTPFSHGATLKISLKGEGRPGSIAVVLGGESASPLGGFAYQLRANADRADERGNILLEIR